MKCLGIGTIIIIYNIYYFLNAALQKKNSVTTMISVWSCFYFSPTILYFISSTLYFMVTILCPLIKLPHMYIFLVIGASWVHGLWEKDVFLAWKAAASARKPRWNREKDHMKRSLDCGFLFLKSYSFHLTF